MNLPSEPPERPTLGRIFSRETYERTLKEKGPNPDVYVCYASYLAEVGQVMDSLEVLAHTYKLYTMTTDKLDQVVSKIVEYVRQDWRENGHCGYRNVLSCPCCWGVLNDPITLPCGHTYCRRCLLKEALTTCRVCQYKLANLSNIKVNVLVCEVVGRWWGGEVKGVTLRTQGNNLVNNHNLQAAVEVYNHAAVCAPQDHLLLSNRSHVLHTLGCAEEALRDAEAAVRCRPEWAKGYFRKAVALTSLGRFEDAFISFLQCAVLEEFNSLQSIKDEIAKALHRLLKRLTSSWGFSMDGRSSHHCHSYFPSPTCSVPPESDSEDSEDGRQQYLSGTSALPEKVPHLRKVLEKFKHEMEKNKKASTGYVRCIDLDKLDKNDFECTLCFRYLYEPVTTPCGHSFCRTCLDRCLDHSTNCPLCKTSIRVYLAERRSAVTEFIEVAMKTVMPNECVERKRQHEEEMDELAAAGKDPHHEIPIFIATLAIPTISCPLHVFEPRYRLMIRRCMESGTREFGMCMPLENGENGYADFGTMLEIRDIEYTQDGRSIVNTVGSRRFKIVSKNVKDGYNTASVEFLQDDTIPSDSLVEIHRLHDTVHQLASHWFDSIESTTKRRILSHYSLMPSVEGEYWTIPNGPAWMWWIVAILPLDSRIQLSILRETSLLRRLEVIHKILRCVIIQQCDRPAVTASQ
ncbi:LON peptidase N-terminal domain and RING finger protein 3 isoform X2 [Cherax quadricarinatus]